jgi:hypothetical protein
MFLCIYMFLRNVGWLSTDYTALCPRNRTRSNHRSDSLKSSVWSETSSVCCLCYKSAMRCVAVASILLNVLYIVRWCCQLAPWQWLCQYKQIDCCRLGILSRSRLEFYPIELYWAITQTDSKRSGPFCAYNHITYANRTPYVEITMKRERSSVWGICYKPEGRGLDSL